MLSYQHAYHAGNLADVHKHSILLACLRSAIKTWPSMAYVESHAGRGRYDLHAVEAEKTKEWRQGIAPLVATDGLEGPLNHYKKFVMEFSKAKRARDLRWYPGSPAIARRVLRRTDRAVLHDLHPQEFDALHGGVGEDTRFELRREDGLAGLQQLNDAQGDKLPTFALIDPSYENKGEFGLVLDRVKAFRQLSAVMVWYPQLTDDRHGALEKWLGEHAELSCFQFKALDPAATAGTKMYGSGMGLMLNNVPNDLAKALRRQMKLITKSLAVWRPLVSDDS